MSATQGTESRTHRTETAAEVVGRLRATFNTGVTRGLDWRVDQLQRLRALLVENEQELIEALWADLRMNATEAKVQEIDFTVADIDEALANLEDWLQPRPVEVPAHFGPTTTAYTTYDRHIWAATDRDVTRRRVQDAEQGSNGSRSRLQLRAWAPLPKEHAADWIKREQHRPGFRIPDVRPAPRARPLWAQPGR
ncbi:hypothetical protein [Streptomyces canus]|uniref:hypothetical protein n=1 Tax=Streptomyces canus TaxID=58343 RepID=UPI002DDAD0EB|nr:hypothetical protein [Streptomyces canus]WSD83060.1 hypothetical protein OG925_01275 [Streptomyces canus]